MKRTFTDLHDFKEFLKYDDTTGKVHMVQCVAILLSTTEENAWVYAGDIKKLACWTGELAIPGRSMMLDPKQVLCLVGEASKKNSHKGETPAQKLRKKNLPRCDDLTHPTNKAARQTAWAELEQIRMARGKGKDAASLLYAMLEDAYSYLSY